jgi:hypothetical protein
MLILHCALDVQVTDESAEHGESSSLTCIQQCARIVALLDQL